MSSKSQDFARQVLAAFSTAGLTSDKQVEAAGGPSSTWMTQVRKVAEGKEEFTKLRSDSLTRIDNAAEWEPGSASGLWHEGVAPTPKLPNNPAAELASIKPDQAGRPRTLFERLTEESDEAQRQFDAAATELVAAEARVDAANERVFSFLALQEKFREEVNRREKELGRALSQIEVYALDGMERPTERERAELRATYAEIDGHERTRYEIALMVRLEGWSHEDAAKGSLFADFASAYKKVDRIVAASEVAKENDQSAKLQVVSDPDYRFEPSAATPPPKKDVEGDTEGDTP